MKKKKMSGGAEIGDLGDEGSLGLDSSFKVRILCKFKACFCFGLRN